MDSFSLSSPPSAVKDSSASHISEVGADAPLHQPCWNVDLVQRATAMWVHECNGPVTFRTHGLTPVLLYLWLLWSFNSHHLPTSLILYGKGCDMHVPFMAEHPIDTYFLNFNQWWDSVLTSLMSSENGYRNPYLEGSLILYSFTKKSSSRFTTGVYELSTQLDSSMYSDQSVRCVFINRALPSSSGRHARTMIIIYGICVCVWSVEPSWSTVHGVFIWQINNF